MKSLQVSITVALISLKAFISSACSQSCTSFTAFTDSLIKRSTPVLFAEGQKIPYILHHPNHEKEYQRTDTFFINSPAELDFLEFPETTRFETQSPYLKCVYTPEIKKGQSYIYITVQNTPVKIYVHFTCISRKWYITRIENYSG